MAALFAVVLLLAASGGVAGDDETRLAVFCPDDAWQGFMDLLSKSDCGSFAGLLSATANAAEIFHERLVSGGGLTVFCPEDKAVAAFDPTFRSLAAGDRAAVLLYHGLAGCYGRKQFKAFNSVSVNTLAEDAASNRSQSISVCVDKGALKLRPAPPSYQKGEALVTKTVSDEAPLALYVVDAVLLPSTVACRGYLAWLRCGMSQEVQLWRILVLGVVNAFVRVIT